jgi:hypothetical protein
MPYRSAETGEYVDEEYAKANPNTTVWEEDFSHEDKTDDVTSDTEQADPKLTHEG